MGLDMYLSKRTYVQNWNHMGDSEKHQITVKKGGKKHPHINPEKITYIIEQAGYWRKANHIHKWFVDNVQGGEDDCKEYHVEFEKLQQLLNDCKEVIKVQDNAKKLLPTTSGFFFGGTEYDEWYFSDVQETINIIEEIVKHKETGTYGEYLPFDVYYSSSW